MRMKATKIPARLVPNELIPALRLSQPLPLPDDASPDTRIHIVHGDEFKCIGYLVRRYWEGSGQYHGFTTGLEQPSREYFVFTGDMAEATRLASLDEGSLEKAFKMPDPILVKKDVR